MTPKAPERPRMAAAAVARMPRSRRLGTLKRRSLAHSQTMIGSSPASTWPAKRCSSAGTSAPTSKPIGGDGVHVRAVGLQLADGAVLDAQRLGQHAHGLVEQQRAVGGAQRQAGQARHGRLAVGALALGGGAPRLGLGALALGDDALAVGAAELARELVDDRGDDDDRRRRQQPRAQLAGVEAPVGERDARADEAEDREHGLKRGLAQAEVDRVRA